MFLYFVLHLVISWVTFVWYLKNIPRNQCPEADVDLKVEGTWYVVHGWIIPVLVLTQREDRFAGMSLSRDFHFVLLISPVLYIFFAIVAGGMFCWECLQPWCWVRYMEQKIAFSAL